LVGGGNRGNGRRRRVDLNVRVCQELLRAASNAIAEVAGPKNSLCNALAERIGDANTVALRKRSERASVYVENYLGRG
jgi:hypothetical protein